MDVEPDPLISPNVPLPSGADVINKLPNEILLKIFGYLKTKFILKNISKVSQRFKMLSNEPTLLRKLEFNNNKDCLNGSMIEALLRCKSLRKLRIGTKSKFLILDRCDEPYISNIVNVAINQCPKITTIKLYFGAIYDTTLLNILKNGKNIESLTVDGYDLLCHESIFPEIFGKMKNLRKLNFRIYFGEKNHNILNALANSCENLEQLSLYESPEAQKYLFKFLENSKCTLKDLMVYDFDEVNQYQKFHNMLGKCKNIEYLCISGHFMKWPENIATFISAISNMKNLTSFAVDNTYGISVSPNAIVTLFSCGHFKNLKALEFYCNYSEEVTENDINDIIEAIEKGCPKLEELELYYNYVSFEISRGRRTIYCNECKVYHLKNQRYYLSQRCPYKE